MGVSLNESLKSLKDFQNWIKTVYKDPIAKILIENSNLTEIQLETLLIDVLSDYFTDRGIKIEEKAKLRIKGEISKGAFNRILKQAKSNIIHSIYTLILLQYLGLISLTTLKKYLEIPEKIKEYMEALKTAKEKEEAEFLREELEKLLTTLADHKKIKKE
ncbi:MAG: hypothetical protein ACXQTQ_00200 [Candidatus Hecatellaceae archaeon]